MTEKCGVLPAAVLALREISANPRPPAVPCGGRGFEMSRAAYATVGSGSMACCCTATAPV